MSDSSATTKAKPQYRHGNLKAAVYQQALHLVATEGSIGFSLRELAESLGVTHAAVYRHYASKQALLAEIAIDGFIGLERQFLAVIQTHGPDVARLGIAYVQYAVDYPQHFYLMFHPEIKPCLAEAPATHHPGAFGLLRDAILRNIESGHFDDLGVEQMALACWSLVHGMAVLCQNGAVQLPCGKHVLAPEAAQHVTRIMMRALARR